MKKYCFYALFFVFLPIIFSCSNHSQNNTPVTQKQSIDTADLRLATDLSVFCSSQVEAAKFTQTKTSAQKVKDLAKQNQQLYAGLGKYLNNISLDYDLKLPSLLSPIASKKLTDLKAIKIALLAHAYLLQSLKDHNIIIREINAAKNIQCTPLKTFVISNQSAIIKQAYALSALKDVMP